MYVDTIRYRSGDSIFYGKVTYLNPLTHLSLKTYLWFYGISWNDPKIRYHTSDAQIRRSGFAFEMLLYPEYWKKNNFDTETPEINADPEHILHT